jgi:hypothetical protein
MICWGSPQSEFINLGVSSSLRFYFSTTYENSKRNGKNDKNCEKHSKRETEKGVNRKTRRNIPTQKGPI